MNRNVKLLLYYEKEILNETLKKAREFVNRSKQSSSDHETTTSAKVAMAESDTLAS